LLSLHADVATRSRHLTPSPDHRYLVSCLATRPPYTHPFLGPARWLMAAEPSVPLAHARPSRDHALPCFRTYNTLDCAAQAVDAPPGTCFMHRAPFAVRTRDPRPCHSRGSGICMSAMPHPQCTLRLSSVLPANRRSCGAWHALFSSPHSFICLSRPLIFPHAHPPAVGRRALFPPAQSPVPPPKSGLRIRAAAQPAASTPDGGYPISCLSANSCSGHT
jgi:hypothetical protein